MYIYIYIPCLKSFAPHGFRCCQVGHEPKMLMELGDNPLQKPRRFKAGSSLNPFDLGKATGEWSVNLLSCDFPTDRNGGDSNRLWMEMGHTSKNDWWMVCSFFWFWWFIPLFLGFQPSKVVHDFASIQSMTKIFGFDPQILLVQVSQLRVDDVDVRGDRLCSVMQCWTRDNIFPVMFYFYIHLYTHPILNIPHRICGLDLFLWGCWGYLILQVGYWMGLDCFILDELSMDSATCTLVLQHFAFGDIVGLGKTIAEPVQQGAFQIWS